MFVRNNAERPERTTAGSDDTFQAFRNETRPRSCFNHAHAYLYGRNYPSIHQQSPDTTASSTSATVALPQPNDLTGQTRKPIFGTHESKSRTLQKYGIPRLGRMCNNLQQSSIDNLQHYITKNQATYTHLPHPLPLNRIYNISISSSAPDPKSRQDPRTQDPTSDRTDPSVRPRI